MNNDDIPTLGEWLRSLPKWKQCLFYVLSSIVGDIYAFEVLGYHRAKRGK